MSTEDDTEENYRRHLADLIGRTRARGGTKYFNKYVNRCRAQAAEAYPKGAAAAHKKDATGMGFIAAIAAFFS